MPDQAEERVAEELRVAMFVFLSGLDHALPIRDFHPARALSVGHSGFSHFGGEFSGSKTDLPSTDYVGCAPSRGKCSA